MTYLMNNPLQVVLYVVLVVLAYFTLRKTDKKP